MNDYSAKQKEYFTNPRRDIISLIPTNPSSKILEIGAGGGDTLIEIKRLMMCKKAIGIELMKIEGSQQQNPLIDQMIYGNVEDIILPFESEYFDVIICGDVLEHLIDPWKVVEKITPFLKKGGVIIASIPNIRVKSALFKIFINGSFQYENTGTFDRTHMRFFCKRDMIELLSTSSLEVTTIKRSYDFVSFNKVILFDKLTLGLFEEFFALQFLLIAKKK